MVDGERANPPSDKALERRTGRWLRSEPFECFVQVAPGLEGALAEELRGGGFPTVVAWERGGASLALDHADVMRANLVLRTASRVLLRIGSFAAATPEMLFDNVGRIPWELHLGRSDTYALRITSRSSKLQAGDGVANTIARAVAKRLRPLGLHPAPAEHATLEFAVRIVDDRCTVSFNTSGEHLHRRGVRRHVNDAPVRETIAAGVALHAFRAHDVIVDPFCGSGTLLLEAADLVAGRLPGRGRSFGFESAAWHRPGRWREVRRLATARATEAAAAPASRLVGMDVDPEALAAARHNLAEGDHAHVDLALGDATALDLDRFAAQRGLVVANVPYGVRLGERADAATTLRRFLERCAAATSPWDLALLTTHPHLVREHEALEVEHMRTIASGGLRVTMVTARTAGS
ncbi:RNA methyltransferase [soil metagenome]